MSSDCAFCAAIKGQVLKNFSKEMDLPLFTINISRFLAVGCLIKSSNFERDFLDYRCSALPITKGDRFSNPICT